jgi:hypothetical protein
VRRVCAVSPAPDVVGCVVVVGGGVVVEGVVLDEEGIAPLPATRRVSGGGGWCTGAEAGAAPRCPARRGELPAVATSNAMRPNVTARITHQFGRPRAPRARRLSDVPGPPRTTAPP